MDEIITQIAPKFNKTIEVVKADLATIRTGKATPSLIENLVVDAYGSKMKLIELGTIATLDVGTLVVTPFDVANTGAITKAIGEANLGLTAISEENRVRVVVPSLSEERRQEYVKLARTKVEGGKVMIRQIRHEAMEILGKADLDEDSTKRVEKEIQTLTDQNIGELEAMQINKEKELLTV